MKMRNKIYASIAVLILGLVSFTSTSSTETDSYPYQLTQAEQTWIDSFVHQAVDWANKEESRLLEKGRPLNQREVEIAKQMGVQQPKHVRVVYSEQLMEIPETEPLRSILLEMGFDSPEFWGMALGRSIIIKPKFEGLESLLSHELVHVAQVEQLGFDNFIERYFIEMRRFGYQDAPLEKEAYAKQLQ